MNLGGTFNTTGGIGTWSNTGGTVNITGTITNYRQHFHAEQYHRFVELNGGTISGGTLAFADSQTLAIAGTAVTL